MQLRWKDKEQKLHVMWQELLEQHRLGTIITQRQRVKVSTHPEKIADLRARVLMKHSLHP
jgi:hypothetical protein